MIVVDTSVLAGLLRGADSPAVRRFEHLEREDVPYAIPTICCQEVLQGARDEREWSLLADYLETQHLLSPLDRWRTHLEAARLYLDCRRRGLTVRSTIDCLIAEMVLERDGILLHDDEDFERIGSVRPLRTIRN